MKTYKQFKKFLRDKCWNERDYGEGIYDKLIYDFLVEEVKENKETIDMDKQNEWIPFEIRHQDSILEKLMEALIKQQENVIGELSQDIDEMSRRCWEGVSSGIEFAIQKLLLLTSLETKEELREMGFKKNDMTHYETYFLHVGPLEITYETSEKKKWWHSFGDEFYPRSREHLESIILAFTK